MEARTSRSTGSLRLALMLGLVVLGVVALAPGCGGGQYGYARTYEALGEEGPYLQREVDLSYEEIRRFPDRHADTLIGWFGTVREIETLDRETGTARLLLELRPHQDRHLCSDETAGSCRVTIAERALGPFVALLTVRSDDLADGTGRLWTGSLLKVYGRVTDQGTEESGPTIEVEWYRHWPHGTYVTTAARGSMRR